MIRTSRRARLYPVAAAAAVLAALVAGCSRSAARADPEPAGSAPDTPGQATVRVDDIDLTITHAVAHLDAAGGGTVTMTVRNGGSVPEHLDMVATPDGGRGTLTGGPGKDSGSMDGAGILMRPGSTVTFGAHGPGIRLTAVRGVTAAHTLPLALQFGVARLVRLSAVVSPA